MARGFDFSAERTLWISRNILPHEPGLRRQLLRWRLPDDLELDDVIQEAYARLATVQAFETIGNPRAYLYQTARMIVLGHFRRSRVVSIQAVEHIDQMGVASEEPDPEVQASDRQQLQLLARMAAALPAPAGTILRLRMIEELSHGEIGARLGMTGNAVQKSLAKTLARFIRQWGRGGLDTADASIDERSENRLERDEQQREQRRDR